MTAHRSRNIEDGLAIAGIIVGALYVVAVEIFPHACYSSGFCERAPVAQPFPWIVFCVIAACVLPKTVGRATAGKVWEIIGSRIPGSRKPDADGTAGNDQG